MKNKGVVVGKKNCKFFIVGLILAFGGNAWGLSDHSMHLLKLQQEFERATPLHTIVYLDREIVQDRLGSLKINQQLQPDLRNAVIAQFIKERIGVNLDAGSADHLGDYFTTGMNVAVPIEVKGTEESICAVLGGNPNATARDEAERLLYWKQMKGKTPEYENREISKMLTSEEALLMADMHETFHCMDPYYIVKQKTLEYENEPTVHRAESFAEVGALLYLAGKGLKNLVETRALFRIVGSFMVGRYGDELIGPNLFEGIDFGVVYSFYPALFATQKKIDDGLTALTLSEIQKLAHEIVEDNAIDSHMAHALTHHQKNPKVLQKIIDDFTNDENEHLRQRFIEVEQHRDNYVDVLNWAFEKLFQGSPTISADH